jgi:hypothetical protein
MPFGIGGNLNVGNAKAISKSVKNAKGMAKGDAVSMIAEIVGMVGSAIITKSYQKKNAKFQEEIERNLAQLSDRQREELRDNLLKIADANERLSVLINYLADKLGTESAIALKSNIDTNVLGAVNKQTKQIYWFVGISVAVLIGIVVVKKIIK